MSQIYSGKNTVTRQKMNNKSQQEKNKHEETIPIFVAEHILKSREACWFSPDGNKLLYATFDNTDVGGTQYTWFGGIVPGSEVRFLKYPRVSNSCK